MNSALPPLSETSPRTGSHESSTATRKLAAHYAIATVLMVIYGTQVCPFIDSLSVSEVALSFAVAIIPNKVEFTITETGGSTNATEGGSTDTYNVVLDSEPIADVIVTITPDVQSDLGLCFLVGALKA